jgi:hypothetical protein
MILPSARQAPAAQGMFEELAGVEEGTLMARVFSLLLAAFLAACGQDSPPPPAQPSIGAYGSPPSIVSGPFLAYLSPGPASMVLPYRRQDWPGPGSGLDQDAGTLPSGAVVNAFSTAPFEVTFRPPGDGGDIYAVRADGPVVALKTKDGGVPKDIFFCGDNWILWGADVGPDWHSVTANIYQARGASCQPPKRTGPAYTRYIEATINVPFIGLQTGTRAIDTIVHEHYDGPSIAQAKGLERMYFGKGIGRYRWEYWAPGRTPLRRLVCPALDYSVPPAPGWVMTDCRMWTYLVPNTTKFSLGAYGWGYP